jgi:uncharacterized membrane protein
MPRASFEGRPRNIATVNIGLVLAGVIAIAAMIAISVYGAVTLPPGSQVPVHHGIGGYNNWQPKTLALISYPAIGVLVFGILFAATSGASGKSGPAVLAPIAMVVIAISEYGAVRAAIKQNGRTG